MLRFAPKSPKGDFLTSSRIGTGLWSKFFWAAKTKSSRICTHHVALYCLSCSLPCLAPAPCVALYSSLRKQTPGRHDFSLRWASGSTRWNIDYLNKIIWNRHRTVTQNCLSRENEIIRIGTHHVALYCLSCSLPCLAPAPCVALYSSLRKQTPGRHDFSLRWASGSTRWNIDYLNKIIWNRHRTVTQNCLSRENEIIRIGTHHVALYCLSWEKGFFEIISGSRDCRSKLFEQRGVLFRVQQDSMGKNSGQKQKLKYVQAQHIRKPS